MQLPLHEAPMSSFRFALGLLLIAMIFALVAGAAAWRYAAHLDERERVQRHLGAADASSPLVEGRAAQATRARSSSVRTTRIGARSSIAPIIAVAVPSSSRTM